MPMTTRLDKYLSNQGLSSRRKVANFLKTNNVSINGTQAHEPGIHLNPIQDKITINGQPIHSPTPAYIILNKPLGVISTVSDQQGDKTVLDFIKTDQRLYPVGRLDKDSTGLILLTNDGDLTYKATHPKFHLEKTYNVTIKGQVSFRQLMQLRNGIRLKDGKTQPARVDKKSQSDSSTTLVITLKEGRHHQIRRMCKAINIHLESIHRTAIGPLKIGNLKPGQSRQLTPQEVSQIKKMIS